MREFHDRQIVALPLNLGKWQRNDAEKGVKRHE